MFSSNNSNNNNKENIIPELKIDENINENEIENSFFQLNNDKIENNQKIFPLNNIKKRPLKNIENTISNKINNNTKPPAKTTIKKSKTSSENITYKTITKQPNNSFNPFFYSSEEKYSLLKMKKIKNNKFSPYKSTNFLYNKVENVFDPEKNDSKLLYFKLKKHKKIFSLKKVYISHIYFENENNNKKEFKLFRDCEIGLNDGNKVKIQCEDFDVDSDDDVIENGEKRCFDNIRTAINLMQKKDEEYVGKYMKTFDNF